jgi:hypothetical protein
MKGLGKPAFSSYTMVLGASTLGSNNTVIQTETSVHLQLQGDTIRIHTNKFTQIRDQNINLSEP